MWVLLTMGRNEMLYRYEQTATKSTQISSLTQPLSVVTIATPSISTGAVGCGVAVVTNEHLFWKTELRNFTSAQGVAAEAALHGAKVWRRFIFFGRPTAFLLLLIRLDRSQSEKALSLARRVSRI